MSRSLNASIRIWSLPTPTWTNGRESWRCTRSSNGSNLVSRKSLQS